MEKEYIVNKSNVITLNITDGKVDSYREKDETQTYAHENVEGFFCGAGDVFASAFVGCLAKGKDEQTAIRLASDFTTAAIRRSATEVPDKRFGLNFEMEIFPFLQKLNEVQ